MTARQHTDAPIGLFDSGVGGGTVLIQLQHLLPTENLLYLADQAHCPYGPRPAAELCRLSIANTHWLLEHGAKLIVVACNTASAAALQTLRDTFPTVPFVGMVPAVKPAASQTRSGVVGVLATPGTLNGGLLNDVVARWAAGTQIITQPCPGLVEQIETGALGTPETRALLQAYLTPLLAAGADTIVLGCTHYPYLLPLMSELAGPHVTLIDPAPAVARQAARVLSERSLLRASKQPGGITYATSSDTERLKQLLPLLGLPEGPVIDCFHPAYLRL